MQAYNRRKTGIRITIPLIILGGLLHLTSCENEFDQGVENRPDLPYLLYANLNHQKLDLDNDTTGSVSPTGNQKYSISILTTGSVFLPAREPVECYIRIFKPTSTSPFFRTSLLLHPVPSDTLPFSTSVQFIVERSDVGSLRFEFAVQSSEGEVSNILARTLQITRQNIKPSLHDIMAPDTMFRPVSGTSILTFSVSAEDPDGYSDLKEVFFKRIFPTETENFLLFDDGNLPYSGDRVPGDAIFSRILSIDSTARLGEQIFLFQASDKSGAFSDSLLHTITILP